MPAIVTNKIRLSTAKQFVESFDEATPTNYYLFIGKSTPWNDDLSPTVPNDTTISQYTIHEDIIFMKKLQATNISHVIRRHNWTTGVVYREYYHGADMFLTVSESVNPFYVVTTTNDEYRVYKCLGNNNGAASTINPSTIDTGIGEGDLSGDKGLIYCSDGYIWKFMYSVSDADMLKFVTSDWIPVKTLKFNDSSRQWNVQTNARDGAIEVIDVINKGTLYTVVPTSITIPAPHKGGTQATLQTLTLTGGSITTPIKMNNVGSGYYKQLSEAANELLTVNGGSTTGDVIQVRAVLSPKGGHGSDAVSELGGVSVMIYVELSGNESNNLITVNDYRRIGIIVDPIELDSINTSQGVATSSPGTITYLDPPYNSSTNPFTQFNNIKVASLVTPGSTFLGKEIVILSGPGKGERRKIIGYHEASDVLLLDRDWPTVSDPTTRAIIDSSSIYGILTNSLRENNLYKFELTTNSTPGSFTIDSTITASGGKSAKIVQYTPASSPDPAYVLVNEVVGQFSASNSISDGTNSATIATATKLGSQEYYGDVIYLENRRPINRASDQTEEIRIVLEF